MSANQPRPRSWWAAHVVLLVIVASVGWTVRGGAQAPFSLHPRIAPTKSTSVSHSVVYPAQDLPSRFDHGKHLARGMTCEQCHTSVRNSTKVGDYNFPKGDACDACHGETHPRPTTASQPCTYCHTKAKPTLVKAVIHAPPARLRFSHARHVGAGVTCERCHGDMKQVGLATVAQLPKEASCLACHDGEKLSNRCDTCHPADLSGRLITRPGNDRAVPPLLPKGEHAWGMTHDLAFVNNHHIVARARPDACASCHDPGFCLDCHTGSVRPMQIHAGNFVRTHAFEAQMNPQRCTACHVQQLDCRACHERVGLRAQGPHAAFGVGKPGSFHPPGFANGAAHAQEALRNMNSCVSCHGEDTCLGCHATTGAATPGNNILPHGPGYAHSLRCDALAQANRRVCLKCHEPGSPRLSCR